MREKLGLRAGGFGLLICQGMVDEMRYNDAGNEVTLIKRFTAVDRADPGLDGPNPARSGPRKGNALTLDPRQPNHFPLRPVSRPISPHSPSSRSDPPQPVSPPRRSDPPDALPPVSWTTSRRCWTRSTTCCGSIIGSSPARPVSHALEYPPLGRGGPRHHVRSADARDDRRRAACARPRTIRPETTRLLFTAYADIRTVIDAINQGHVFRYLAKPWDPDELEVVVRQAVEHHDLIVEKNRLLAELQAANAKLTEANRLKGAFIEVASHELNTPVTVVLGMIELWKMSQGPDASPAGTPVGRSDRRRGRIGWPGRSSGCSSWCEAGSSAGRSTRRRSRSSRWCGRRSTSCPPISSYAGSRWPWTIEPDLGSDPKPIRTRSPTC